MGPIELTPVKLRCVFIGALACCLSMAPAATGIAAPAASLVLVGGTPLGNRGMNAALAVAEHCAFVGSRNDAAPQVVDISNPAAPVVVGGLAAHPGSTPRELRAVPALHELAVLFYRLNGGLNGFDLYHWDSDCARPVVAGHYDFGGAAPHEFYLWQDPANATRVLLFVSMFATATQELQVIDISDLAHPVNLGGWAVPGAYGHAPLHSISVSGDGRTAYISLWTGGLVVADSSDFAMGKPGPVVRPLTPPGAAFRTPPGNVHSAVPVPGQPTRLVTTDERYPAPFGAGCPFGSAHVVDISNPAQPVAVSTLAVPENAASACSAAPHATWTSHNPTLTAHLALLTWYSAGLEVFSLDDPAQPTRVAEYRAAGVNPTQRDLQLGTTDTLSWSYPVIVNGLIYVVDINQGLLILRYEGPHEDEVAGLRFAEGNSNITTAAAAVAHPTPSAAAATPPSAVPRSASPGPVPTSPRRVSAAALLGGGAVAFLLLLGMAALTVRASRRGGSHRKL